MQFFGYILTHSSWEKFNKKRLKINTIDDKKQKTKTKNDKKTIRDCLYLFHFMLFCFWFEFIVN